MKKFLLISALMFVGAIAAWAQDVIVTRNAQKIDAKVIEISDTEVKYKKQSNPDGPTYVEKKSNIATIVYSNGDVEVFADVVSEEPESANVKSEEPKSAVVETPEDKPAEEIAASLPTAYSLTEWKGKNLPKFVYQRVEVPGKKYKKYRYVSVDGSLVLTSAQFENLIEAYCPEAFKYVKRSRTFLVLEAVSIFLGLIPVLIFYVCGISASGKILPTYNNSCATQPISMEIQEEESDTAGSMALAIP